MTDNLRKNIIEEYDALRMLRKFEAFVREELGRASIVDSDIILFLNSQGHGINPNIKIPNLSCLEVKLSWTILKGKEYDDFIYLDKKYDLGVLFYAASGYDLIPRDVLGAERVVHLSLEGYGCLNPEFQQYLRYFSRLGKGKKVIGDVAHVPFLTDSFDSTFCNVDFLMKQNFLDEYLRVTKQNGILILNSSDLYCYDKEPSVQTALNDKRLKVLEKYKQNLIFQVKK